MRGNSHLRGEALSTTNRGLKLTLIKITRSDVNATLHKRQHQIQPNSGCSPGDDCEAIAETLEHGHTARILIEVCSTVCRKRSFLADGRSASVPDCRKREPELAFGGRFRQL